MPFHWRNRFEQISFLLFHCFHPFERNFSSCFNFVVETKRRANVIRLVTLLFLRFCKREREKKRRNWIWSTHIIDSRLLIFLLAMCEVFQVVVTGQRSFRVYNYFAIIISVSPLTVREIDPSFVLSKFNRWMKV